MKTYLQEKTVRVETAGQMRDAIKDLPDHFPLLGSLGGQILVNWLKDDDTGEIEVEIEEA